VVPAQPDHRNINADRAFRAFCEGTPLGVLLIGADGAIEWASPSVQGLLGWRPAELAGRSILELISADDLEVAARILEDTQSDPMSYDVDTAPDRYQTIDLALLNSDGTPVTLEVTGNAFLEEDEVNGVLVVLREVTHRRLVDDSLELLARGADCETVMVEVVQLAESVISKGRAAVVVLDQVAVPAGVVSTGVLPGPTTQPAPEVALMPDGYWMERFDGAAVGSSLRMRATFPLIDENDGLSGYLVIWSPEHRPFRQWTLIGIARAIRVGMIGIERERAERSTKWAASHDSLTGAWSRNAFWDEAARRAALADDDSPLGAIVWVDLDDFKRVNDTYGHGTGDEVLRRTADRIAAAVRADDVVCRLGGDEFIVLCPGLDDFEAAAIGERLDRLLARPMRVGDLLIEVTASVGVAVGELSAEGLDALLEQADGAMYASKHRR